jgi:hypothetical protein
MKILKRLISTGCRFKLKRLLSKSEGEVNGYERNIKIPYTNNEIESLTKKKLTVEQKNNDKLGAFKNELPVIASKWIEEQAKYILTNNSFASNKLGYDGLRKMKAEVNHLVNNLTVIIADKSVPLTENESRFIGFFRKTISNLGPIIYNYGFLQDSHSNKFHWEKRDGKWLYTGELKSIEKHFPSISGYNDLVNKHAKMNQMLHRKKIGVVLQRGDDFSSVPMTHYNDV